MKKLKLFDPTGKLKEPAESEYNEARTAFIADYKIWKDGGLFSSGNYFSDPELARAVWDKKYPSGYDEWKAREGSVLSAYGQRELVRAHDELVKVVNKLIEERNGQRKEV